MQQSIYSGPMQTSDIDDVAETSPSTSHRAWAHFVAGAAGGIAATTATAPLDIVKTRLQSSMYSAAAIRVTAQSRPSVVSYLRSGVGRFERVLTMISTIYKTEGPAALFRGLGPNLVGYVPSTGLKFMCYGKVKATLAANYGDSTWTHLTAGIAAGLLTCTVTNPFWVIKTRLQLDRVGAGPGASVRQYTGAVDCARLILQHEGVKGLYGGLAASYIGTIETAIQWALYERFKKIFNLGHDRQATQDGEISTTLGQAFAAGSSKLLAAVALYPHEVLRTRLREVPKQGTDLARRQLWPTIKHIVAREGIGALYGGLAAHLLRVVPSTAIVFSVYEIVLGTIGS